MRESLTPYIRSCDRPVDRAGATRVAQEVATQAMPSSTRSLTPQLTALLRSLTPGERIQVTQTVRVGRQTWTTTVPGTFRNLNHLVTGLATDRVPEDDIVVALIHFTKDNGELSSIAFDENTRVERLA